MTLSVDRILEMLSDLDDYELRWSNWETEFLTNLKTQFEQNDKFKLSDAQIKSLTEIYDKYCKKPN